MRKRQTEQDWQEHFQKQSLSGRSIAAYCRENNLLVGSFYQWRSRIQNSAVALSTGFARIVTAERPCAEPQPLKTQVKVRITEFELSGVEDLVALLSRGRI